jgi:GNAT superfamily N-acetyltransferase
VWAGVARDRRGKGHGSGLVEVAEGHVRSLGATTLESWAEEEDGKRFLRARGFDETRQTRVSAVDPRRIDFSALGELERVKEAEGFRAIPLREVLARAREIYALYMIGEADMPSDYAEDNIAFEEWERETLAQPEVDRDGSFIVVAGDGRPVSLALLEVDREGLTAANEMTATLREFRRRGLARLAKLASLRWAAELGVTSVLTSNDRENPGMLALNDELGYEPLLMRAIFRRDLTH